MEDAVDGDGRRCHCCRQFDFECNEDDNEYKYNGGSSLPPSLSSLSPRLFGGAVKIPLKTMAAQNAWSNNSQDGDDGDNDNYDNGCPPPLLPCLIPTSIVATAIVAPLLPPLPPPLLPLHSFRRSHNADPAALLPPPEEEGPPAHSTGQQ
jgi:hypothetical protein